MNKSKFKKLFWIIGGGIAAYFLLLIPPVFKFSSDAVFVAVSPIVKVGSFVVTEVNDFLNSAFALSDLAKKNKELELEVANLKNEIVKLSNLKKENEDLRAQLSFKQNLPDVTLIEAKVISRDPSGFSQIILIDKGLSDGLAEDKPVVYGGYLVGRIKEVFGKHSVVELITSPNSAVPAITLSSRSQGLVRGSYGFDVILEEIDQADDVAIGEDVITSGVGGRYPEGLLIGSVRKVESQKNKIFKSATLKLPFEIRKLERVFVIR